MISQNALKHANKCRFCWMCRHLCPVQLQTGKEINTPRAKGLLLSMNQRGKVFTPDEAQAMYECLLCDACTNDCATGYQPPLFIREARTEAVVNDIAPKPVMQLIDNIERTGNIYGEAKPAFAADASADTLLYIGEVAAIKTPQMVKAFLDLMKKSDVHIMTLADEPSSGVMLGDLMGYTAEVQEQAKACAAAINASGAKTVVVLDSYDAEIMAQKYGEWGCEIKAELVTATAFAAKLAEEGRIAPKAAKGALAACHDDDRLARTFHEFEPIRALAKSAGYEPVEMFNHGRLAKSAGSAVALGYMPEITKKVAAGRWDDLARTEARIMLTANPEAYLCLSQCVPEGMMLVDVYSALDA